MFLKRSVCPITNSLDLFGDKWTLLIVRDLVLGKKHYQEFLSSPEGIATNILANRLKRLQDKDIVVRKSYQHNPKRYEYFLTNKGDSLKIVLKALSSWGLKNFPWNEEVFSLSFCTNLMLITYKKKIYLLRLFFLVFMFVKWVNSADIFMLQ